MRVYAAGVRSVKTEGCLPLLGRWDSLAQMLQFFPNLKSIAFEGIRAHYCRDVARAHRDRAMDELWLSQEVRAENSVLCPPATPHLPEGLDYDCLYFLEDELRSGLNTTAFSRDADGCLILPEVLCLPACSLLIWGSGRDIAAWMSVLRQRKAQGIKTYGVLMRVKSLAELDLLAEAAGDSLTGLEVLYSSHDFWDVDQAATATMNQIDVARFPHLHSLTIRIDFPCGDAPHHSPVPSEWLSYDLPPRLSSIQLDLVFNVWEWEYLHFNDDSSESVLPMEYANHVFEEDAPREFILDVRTKLGEEFPLLVENQCQNGLFELTDYRRPMTSYVDYLLYEPLAVLDGDSSDNSSDTSSGDSSSESACE